MLLKSFSKGKPSQNHLNIYKVDLLNQKNLLSSFSNLPHQITFSKPSQHIKDEFPQLSKQLFLSQLEINHVIQQQITKEPITSTIVTQYGPSLLV